MLQRAAQGGGEGGQLRSAALGLLQAGGCLVLWGRHDTFFEISEVMAYHQDVTTLDAHLYDGEHFLLETHAGEVAALLVTFVGDVLDRAEVQS